MQIKGHNLDQVNRVTFNGAVVSTDSVVLISPDSMTVKVPATATTGPIHLYSSSDSAVTDRVFYVGILYFLDDPTVTSMVGCQGVFFDHENGQNYLANTHIIKTIRPGMPGSFIQLAWNSFKTESGFDFVNIYDGLDTTAPLIAHLSGQTLPRPVTATNPAGALTIKFTSDGVFQYPGFNATIRCKGYAVSNFTPQHGIAGDTVTVTGVGLDSTYAILFNQNPVVRPQFRVADSHTIRVAVPTGTAADINGPLTFYSNRFADTVVTAKQFRLGGYLVLSNDSSVTCGNTLRSHDGGGNYPSSSRTFKTLAPSTAGKAVEISFDSVSVSFGDSVIVHDGDINGPVLNAFTGYQTSLPIVVDATNPSGKLTVVFITNAQFEATGFVASINCVDFTHPTINGITPSYIRPGFPYTVYTSNANASTSLQLNGTPSGATYSNAVGGYQGIFPTGATAGMFSVSNVAGTSTWPIRVLPGNYALGKNSDCGSAGATQAIGLVLIKGTTLRNASDCNLDLLYNDIAYPDTLSMTGSIHAGSTDTIEVITEDQHAIAMWIDYNQNQTFDASEYTLITSDNTGGYTPAFASFHVPSDAVLGKTAMRIRAKTNSSVPLGAGDAYTQLYSGESEDYTITILQALGVQANTSKSALTLYPNPNDGNFTLDLGNLSGNGEVKITDALGRVVHTQQVAAGQSNGLFNVSHLQGGIYSVELFSNGTVSRRQMVIRK